MSRPPPPKAPGKKGPPPTRVQPKPQPSEQPPAKETHTDNSKTETHDRSKEQESSSSNHHESTTATTTTTTVETTSKANQDATTTPKNDPPSEEPPQTKTHETQHHDDAPKQQTSNTAASTPQEKKHRPPPPAKRTRAMSRTMSTPSTRPPPSQTPPPQHHNTENEEDKTETKKEDPTPKTAKTTTVTEEETTTTTTSNKKTEPTTTHERTVKEETHETTKEKDKKTQQPLEQQKKDDQQKCPAENGDDASRKEPPTSDGGEESEKKRPPPPPPKKQNATPPPQQKEETSKTQQETTTTTKTEPTTTTKAENESATKETSKETSSTTTEKTHQQDSKEQEKKTTDTNTKQQESTTNKSTTNKETTESKSRPPPPPPPKKTSDTSQTQQESTTTETKTTTRTETKTEDGDSSPRPPPPRTKSLHALRETTTGNAEVDRDHPPPVPLEAVPHGRATSFSIRRMSSRKFPPRRERETMATTEERVVEEEHHEEVHTEEHHHEERETNRTPPPPKEDQETVLEESPIVQMRGLQTIPVDRSTPFVFSNDNEHNTRDSVKRVAENRSALVVETSEGSPKNPPSQYRGAASNGYQSVHSMEHSRQLTTNVSRGIIALLSHRNYDHFSRLYRLLAAGDFVTCESDSVRSLASPSRTRNTDSVIGLTNAAATSIVVSELNAHNGRYALHDTLLLFFVNPNGVVSDLAFHPVQSMELFVEAIISVVHQVQLRNKSTPPQAAAPSVNSILAHLNPYLEMTLPEVVQVLEQRCGSVSGRRELATLHHPTTLSCLIEAQPNMAKIFGTLKHRPDGDVFLSRGVTHVGSPSRTADQSLVSPAMASLHWIAPTPEGKVLFVSLERFLRVKGATVPSQALVDAMHAQSIIEQGTLSFGEFQRVFILISVAPTTAAAPHHAEDSAPSSANASPSRRLFGGAGRPMNASPRRGASIAAPPMNAVNGASREIKMLLDRVQ